jgi:hypothetical protein
MEKAEPIPAYFSSNSKAKKKYVGFRFPDPT